ncbi:MAG: hypothetical protein V4651_09205 [Bacteroidota bacterium]
MEELIDLPVTYKGVDLTVTARMLAHGCVYKLSVDVNGIEVLFDLDEQRNYSTMLAAPKADATLIS